MARHKLVRREGVVGGEHLPGEVAHDGLRRQVEVAEHLVRSPPTKDLDDVCVDVGDQQGHGSCCAKGACRDFRREETQVSADDADGCAKGVSDV